MIPNTAAVFGLTQKFICILQVISSLLILNFKALQISRHQNIMCSEDAFRRYLLQTLFLLQNERKYAIHDIYIIHSTKGTNVHLTSTTTCTCAPLTGPTHVPHAAILAITIYHTFLSEQKQLVLQTPKLSLSGLSLMIPYQRMRTIWW